MEAGRALGYSLIVLEHRCKPQRPDGRHAPKLTLLALAICGLLSKPARLCAEPPRRIVSTSPRNTELLYQIGLGDHLAATSDWSEHPKAAQTLPRVGPLFSPSIELTRKYGADLVVTEKFTSPENFSVALEVLGIPEKRWDAESVEGLFTLLEDSAREFPAATDPTLLTRYRACLAGLKSARHSKKFSFLAFAWHSPPILFGSESFLSDLLTYLGGTNLAPSTAAAFPLVAEDWVRTLRPDQVYFLGSGDSEREGFQKKALAWWKVAGVPPLLFLSNEHFGRSSLTPLQHLAEALPAASSQLVSQCRDLP